MLLSLFSTVHYGYCMQLQESDWPTWLGGAVGLLCPAPTGEAPFLTLALLSILNILFMALDYQYKKFRGFDPVRGLLWSEVFDLRKEGLQESPVSEANNDWRKLQPQPTRIKRKSYSASLTSKEDAKLSFAASPEDMQLLLSGAYPVNRHGMVPWFSTFIAGTALQAVLGALLNFLTFDQRGVELHATPKIFHLSFLHRFGTHNNSSMNTDISGGTSALEQDVPCSSPTEYEDDVWFDFIGDVGDGFNSTYEMARLLAQPALVLPGAEARGTRRRMERALSLRLEPRCNGARTPSLPPTTRGTEARGSSTPRGNSAAPLMLDDYAPEDFHSLPRASFVIIGGDLAYPNPTDETYRTRLQKPYDDALRSCKELRDLMQEREDEMIVRDKDDNDVAHISMLSASRVAAMVRYGGFTNEDYSEKEILSSVPLLFSIPGNHDWLDGLVTFKKFIVESKWLGGWFMPQRSSFFILKIPHNWFIFCGDTGSTADIDCVQRNYFLNYIERNLDEESCAIVTCHEPSWVYEAMHKSFVSPMQPQLNMVLESLGTRLRLRICGDIHHYSRHEPVNVFSEAPTLIVSGGGGAFLHGVRNELIISQGTEYRRSSAFPFRNEVTSILARLVGFRLINWKFDIIAGFLCFALIVSALPLAVRDGRTEDVTEVSEFAVSVIGLTVELFAFTLDKAIVSFIVTLIFFGVFFSAGADKKSMIFRLMYAIFWTALVLLSSTGVLAVVQTTIVYMTNNRMLLSRRGHWESMMEVQVRSAADTVLNHTKELLGNDHVISSSINKLQLAAYGSTFIEGGCVLLRSLDVVENLAYLSHHVSMNETGKFSSSTDRVHIFLYYLHLILIYWLLATPLISFVIGMFLFVSVHFFDFMYDAAYSSFQIEDYKHFVRFRIDRKTRELHGYVVAEKRVPKVWKRDPKHVSEFMHAKAKHLPPHLRKWPSRWQPMMEAPGKESGAEILEHFVLKPHRMGNQAVRSEYIT